jgi:hypothetical protein
VFKRIAILSALAAGTVVLTACGAAESASGSEQEGSTRANVELTTEEDESVDCGEVEVNGSTHTLVAVRATGGVVGCTEAFTVLDEYLTTGTATLSDSWACATDDGVTAGVVCVKGDAEDDHGLAFHTRPPQPTESGTEALEPVDCGALDVDGNQHTLTAQPAATGIVGCTEAFTVIDEYLAIPVAERGADLDGTELSTGWSCVTDDGVTAGIGCVRDRVGDEYGFAFSTTPV